MRRLILAAVVFAFMVGIAYAAPPEPLNWGSQISGQCSMDGELVVNVVMKVTNSIDSGEGGNYWATENYNRTIQVWSQEDGSYCARVMYLGKFSGVAGQTSPGNVGPMTGAERGSFEGGYWATIHGSLKSTPDWATNGFVGTFDYHCDAVAGTCTTPVNWFAAYFDSYTYDLNWWGWTYHGGKYGSWVNSVDGNSGDILEQ